MYSLLHTPLAGCGSCEKGSSTDLRRFGCGIPAIGPVADVWLFIGAIPRLMAGRLRVVARDSMAVRVSASVFCLEDDAHDGIGEKELASVWWM